MNGQFGVISKAVMQDKELHVIAKAVYCYIACFADQRGRAYPSRALMCRDLEITKDTLTKYLKQLTECGYLRIEKNKRQGRFSNNVYYLPCHKISDTVLSDTVESDTVLSDTVKQSLTIPVLNNTKETKPSINITRGREPPTHKKSVKHNFGEYHHVMLTDDEHKKLLDDLGDNTVNEYIKRLDEYIEQTGKSYKNHSLTIRKWYNSDNRNNSGYSADDNQYANIYDMIGGKNNE